MQIMPDEEMNMCLQMLEVLSIPARCWGKASSQAESLWRSFSVEKPKVPQHWNSFPWSCTGGELLWRARVCAPACNTLEKAQILINLLRNNTESPWKLMRVYLEWGLSSVKLYQDLTLFSVTKSVSKISQKGDFIQGRLLMTLWFKISEYLSGGGTVAFGKLVKMCLCTVLMHLVI